MDNGSGSSSTQNLRGAWVRWVIPSIGDLIFIALLGMLTLTQLSVRLLGDAGIGWHIRAGQWILAEHTVPPVDFFSATMQGKPWFAWEWLYDAAVGRLESAVGLNGVVLLTALVIAGVFWWTFRLMVRRGTNVAVAVALVLLAASASMIHFLARPHVVSWLFTVAGFWVLDSSEKDCFAEGSPKDQRILWLLPFLMLVWVNVHAGWLVGLALLAIYWISAVWAWFAAANDKLDGILLQLRAAKRAKDLFLVGIFSAVATFVNPYGWRLHRHIYQYLSNRFLMDHIDEFRSPNFHGVAQRCFAILILIAFVALGTKRRRVRVSEGLVALFAVYSGLVASRNIPFASLLLVLVAGPLLSDAFEQAGKRRVAELRSAGQPVRPRLGQAWATAPTFFGRMASIELSLRGHLWPLLAVVLSCWVAMNGGRLGPKQLMDAHFDTTRFPVSAVDFVNRERSREPVLCPDYWGGYLIYRLHPRTLVVADDRHDLYGEEFFKAYLKMMHVEPGWEELIRKQNVHRILMPRGSPVANILAETAGWRVTYQDNVAVLFEQK